MLDDENQLIRITVTNSWKSDFVYDGKMRRRMRFESTWNGSKWITNTIVRYLYDGNLVIQERDSNNVPLVTYTHGNDLSGSLQGAGGIGGLLARTDNRLLTVSEPGSHAYYHADGNGNVTALVSPSQMLVAKYLYDPFGNILSQSGPLADANLYRFSSKEVHPTSGLIYYLYRSCDPNLQRWLNRDPLDERGFGILSTLQGSSIPEKVFAALSDDNRNPYAFVANTPLDRIDASGLTIWYCPTPTGPGFPAFGIGRHAYLWDDRATTPFRERECGQESACGSGPHSSGNFGPGVPPGAAPPGTHFEYHCVPIPGTTDDKKATDLMKYCRGHINNNFIWVPPFTDCHTRAETCMKHEGLTPPKNPRF